MKITDKFLNWLFVILLKKDLVFYTKKYKVSTTSIIKISFLNRHNDQKYYYIDIEDDADKVVKEAAKDLNGFKNVDGYKLSLVIGDNEVVLRSLYRYIISNSLKRYILFGSILAIFLLFTFSVVYVVNTYVDISM